VLFKGSRYAAVPQATRVDERGREVRYVRVRLIPETRAVAGHRVLAHDRLDLLAHRYYRDPERFWRICDANRALWPDDLLVEGEILGIPPSEG
jgi:hypothetical protein